MIDGWMDGLEASNELVGGEWMGRRDRWGHSQGDRGGKAVNREREDDENAEKASIGQNEESQNMFMNKNSQNIIASERSTEQQGRRVGVQK